MNAVHRGIFALAGAGSLAVLQYFIGQPWRYWITSGELVAIAIALVVTWSKTRHLEEVTEEHQARLDAIAAFAEKAQVVHDANRIVDSITATLYVHEEQEPVV